MGLFDPSRVLYRRLLAEGPARRMYCIVEVAAESFLGDMPRHRKEFVLGAVMALWVEAAVSDGMIELSDFNRRRIANTGALNFRSLREEERRAAASVIERLQRIAHNEEPAPAMDA